MCKSVFFMFLVLENHRILLEILEKSLKFTQIYLYFSGVKSIFETMAASPGSYSQEDIQKLKKDYGVK